MKFVFLLLAGLTLTASAGAVDDKGFPVIVELFTSEGCSSCPPADELLERLERTDARVIGLEEHVDYWNNLGWVDRFSSPLFRARQNQYSQIFKEGSMYTPQMIANGRIQFAGNDLTLAMREINEAAGAPSYSLRMKQQHHLGDSPQTEVAVFIKSIRASTPVAADVFLAVAEKHLTTNVLRGENARRSLRHGPVVRSFGVIGVIEPKKFNEVGIKSTLKIPIDWDSGQLRAIVFVQEKASGQITGAAALDLR